MDWGLATLCGLVGVGLVAGVLGGLLGVGGSVVMIPALVILFGQDRTPGMNQHLYQAAAMAVNVAVAVPAAWRHRRAGAMRWGVIKWLLPTALVMIFVGVGLSNLVTDPVWLGRLLAAFLVYVIVMNVGKLLARRGAATDGVDLKGELRGADRWRAAGIGGVMGTTAGLLGLGGGGLAVPMMHTFLRLPLRVCIANSAAVMCVTAGLGAAAKMSTLPEGLSAGRALLIAAVLAPTAIAGGLIGASLTHRLPIRVVGGGGGGRVGGAGGGGGGGPQGPPPGGGDPPTC
ncbi:MAG: sulfite exporter TauE/SafE family protein [Planctomycetota bacterium]